MQDGGQARLPLEGVRVAEVSSGYAAGLAGRLLRGYGAHVSRLDTTAFGRGVPLTDGERLALHTGKHEISTEGNWRAAVHGADLVVSDLQPSALRRLELDWLRDRRGGQVVVSVTPFGLTGPMADARHTNAVAFALGGIMGLTGDPDRSPLVTGGSQAYALAGINAFGAAVTAWLGRVRHGRGDLVDLSGQECAAGMLEYYGPYASYHGVVTRRLGNHTRATWAVYPCLDGWAGVFALERQAGALFALMDDPELDEPRFRDPLQRLQQQQEDELTAKLYVWFSERTKAELQALGLATRVPFGTATTPAELVAAEGLLARDAIDRVADVSIPGRPFPGLGWRRPTEPVALPDGPAVEGPVSPAPAPLPLRGVRVLDLTMMWAGPFATLRLAEMGADVIKIESPSAWDNIRTLIAQPGVEDPWNSAFYFNAYNRDKRSLTLDLAQDAGRELLLRLVETADVLIENYRADVMDKLGLSVEVLRARNPRLIVISMAAFGKEGPDRGFVGFGPVIELMSGLAALSGYGDGEPFKTGISYGDPVAGTAAVAAVSLALVQRERTGEGVWIDLAQRETSLALIAEQLVAASRGEEPRHLGCGDARFPQGCFRALGEDDWIVVSVPDATARDGVAGLVGVAADDPGFEAALAEWCSHRTALVAQDSLQAAGVPAGRVIDAGALLEDPQLVARNYWVELPHPKMHPYRQQGAVWHLAEARPAPRRHSPLFGEHNHEILVDELGIGPAELARLTADAVIADAPINPGVG